jgi:D-glycero-D-manno-heptose 1,7-bisphosphate phosphatase
MGIDALTAAVFLDRDGVINQAIVKNGKPYPPDSPADLVVLPGVADALARLKRRGFALIVVTNQPDVARGRQRREVVEAMHAQLASQLPLDEFRVCYHDDGDDCACRKPRPGLLMQAPAYDLARSVLVGDRWRDIEAGRRAGVGTTMLIDYGYDERLTTPPDVVVGSLSEAAAWLEAQGLTGHP